MGVMNSHEAREGQPGQGLTADKVVLDEAQRLPSMRDQLRQELAGLDTTPADRELAEFNAARRVEARARGRAIYLSDRDVQLLVFGLRRLRNKIRNDLRHADQRNRGRGLSPGFQRSLNADRRDTADLMGRLTSEAELRGVRIHRDLEGE